MPPPMDRIELLRRLVAYPSVSHTGNREIADFAAGLLDDAGAAIERQTWAGGEKVNLLARLGPETSGGLTLCGHLDVVPAGETGWSSPPFALTDAGDRWVGRGACDMKGFVALALEIATTLDAAALRRPLGILLTADEEVGSLGAQRIRRTGGGADLPRATLVGEPTSLAVVGVHKGHLRLRITVRGESAHSGYPHRGRSAIAAAGRAVVALTALGTELAAERPAGYELFPDVPFTTLNIGRIEGGRAVNVVAEECVLELGLRPLPGADREPLLDRLRQAVGGALPDDDWTLEIDNDSPPLRTAAEAPIHRELLALRGQSQTRGSGYSSDAGALAAAGFDCVLYGPGSIEVAHKPDEFVPKAELETAAADLRRLVERFCAAEQAP